ncbi:MAG: chemotaxis protein CheB, partial [Candidatus Obscuribacterales bacterium]|nr:chemotaxis protein CheB [Candidatus Obscuribacterales bacterium]
MEDPIIKVMVIEDEPTRKDLLIGILHNQAEFELAEAGSAEEALRLMAKDKPDLITIGIKLNGMDALSFTRLVMQKDPVPILVVSSVEDESEMLSAFDIIEAGALAAIETPVDSNHQDYQRLANQLISTIKTMAEVKLVRRRTRLSGRAENKSLTLPKRERGEQALVTIGASTGGPAVIQHILKGLPPDFPAPIVIAQHIAPGFLGGLVSWLVATTSYRVEIAVHRKKLEPGVAYLCPEGFQTGITSGGRFDISDKSIINGVRPSVAHLFKSAGLAYGKRTLGVLLTGMGRDGARELKTIRDIGGTTVVQDRKTSIVHGMPGEAIRLGAASHVVAASDLA